MSRIVGLILCCILAACTQGSEEAKGTADVVPAGGNNAVADDPVCTLFSKAEAARYIGEPAADGQGSAGGCQWNAADGSGDMIVAVVPAGNHEPPKQSRAYKPLADAGTEGFVSTYLDGWIAGAVIGEEAIRVSVAGAGASEATAVALLKDTIKRRP